MLLKKGLKCMVKMYSRSCVALEQAKDALSKVGRDDAYLNLKGYRIWG